MSLNMTSFDAALKEHYTDDRVENMVYRDNPFLALVSKMEDFGGKNLPIPLIYGNPQGRSSNFAQAQTRGQVTSSLVDAFTLIRKKDYSIATVDNETLEASKGNANAFMEAATTEIDGAINSLTRSIAIALYRDGSGSIGIVSNPTASPTLTLATEDDITNFEVGMQLVLAASGVQKAGTFYVGAINRSAGTLSAVDVSGAPVNITTAVATAANGDQIVVQGDFNSKLSGLEAWIPSSAPSSTPFFGVDRTVDVTRLAGLRYNASGVPLEEALNKGASMAAREGAKVDHAFMNYSTFADLENALGSKVQYVDLKMNAEIGFRGIQINGPRGPIQVVPDQNCPANRIFMVQLDTWKLYSLGKAVRVIDTDGLQMLRQASADGIEVRYGFYGNLGSRAPGYNINIQL